MSRRIRSGGNPRRAERLEQRDTATAAAAVAVRAAAYSGRRLVAGTPAPARVSLPAQRRGERSAEPLQVLVNR
jgi:hypothetical protein